MPDTAESIPNRLNLTASIVAAYLSNNSVATSDVPTVIGSVYSALSKTMTPEAEEPAPALVPAVSIKKSVSPDTIVCLECGKKLKMLKRHLATDHGLTLAQYRDKWSLPGDYPAVAPNYAKSRSVLAKATGLGRPKQS